ARAGTTSPRRTSSAPRTAPSSPASSARWRRRGRRPSSSCRPATPRSSRSPRPSPSSSSSSPATRESRLGVSEYERRNREFWDADADAYQSAHAADLDRAPRAWGVWRIPEADVDALGDVVGRDVLEYGCGAAQWSIALARMGARPVGLDQSRSQL